MESIVYHFNPSSSEELNLRKWFVIRANNGDVVPLPLRNVVIAFQKTGHEPSLESVNEVMLHPVQATDNTDTWLQTSLELVRKLVGPKAKIETRLAPWCEGDTELVRRIHITMQ